MIYKIGDKLKYNIKLLQQSNNKWIRKYHRPLFRKNDIYDMSKTIFTIIKVKDGIYWAKTNRSPTKNTNF